MYKFAGYTIKVDDNYINNFFLNKEGATEVIKTNIPQGKIVQLFYFDQPKYQEPVSEPAGGDLDHNLDHNLDNQSNAARNN